jgi:NADPH:quinone reductase-like Zn-dependent oxidoreductase
MKAAVHYRYGSPDVVSIAEIGKPVPKDHELLIRVYASTVNRTDTGFRSAEYFISRFFSGLLRPNSPVLGCEFAGVVEAAGKRVQQFKVGDRVFGFNDKTFGGHAEYMTIAEEEAIATIPDNLRFEEAAPITEGAHYALNAIKASKIKSDQRAMVYGATGAIGTAAVQLLKYFGVNVTSVCNTKNVDLVKSIGADTVIDYQTEDFTKIQDKFHFIFDAVGKSSFSQCKPLLTEKGVYISTEFGKNGSNVFWTLVTAITGGKKVLFPIPSINKEIVQFLKQLVEQGRFKPVIDKHYPLDQITEAHRYVDTGQKTGNVVIVISK